ncbi:MAG: YeeE/YedE family protein [Bacteroidetes bacterium]|jgi:uncharacterized membrane protein YedE/YeeE|nr:YeeE/YedE family protein [Bacteroidota bacterium]
MLLFNLLSDPWPWYIAGPLVGLMVPILLLIGNKSFGISSSLRHLCAACVPAGIPFFQYNWRAERWNLLFVAGVILGGGVAALGMQGDHPVGITPWMQQHLTELGVQDFGGLLPQDVFGLAQLGSVRSLVFWVVGGFMVGFGTRYAGGCTSGHSILGISTLQWPSVVATCCFMVGGFLSTHLLVPFLLSL